MKVIFSKEAYKDYEKLKKDNKNSYLKIKELILDIEKDGYLGKREKLKHSFSGYESRRITHKDRLVYIVNYEKQEVYIYSCKHHY
jgi:toxin YoeB